MGINDMYHTTHEPFLFIQWGSFVKVTRPVDNKKIEITLQNQNIVT